jgi:hypothetical protein
MLEQYEVLLRHKKDASRWSLLVQADNFGHAEEQAIDYLKDESNHGYEIIRIEKDYA